MATNYVLLSSTVLSATTATVTFSNIPTSGYTNLKIYASARGTRSNPTDTMLTRLNGDSSTALYDYVQMYGYGSGGAVGSGSGAYALFNAMPAATSTANYFGVMEQEIFGYTSSDFKPCRSADGAGMDANNNWQINDTSVLYKSTSPVTSVTFACDAGSFVAGSTFAIYGLATETQTPATPKASGGNIVVSDGTYWYHAFTSSGSFIPNQALTCDMLVVAGGGSGETNVTAGGGAGGALGLTSQALLTSNYSVVIGAGAPGGNGYGYQNGSNTQFGALTAAVGGGASGVWTNGNGVAGGSGGGGAGYTGTGGGRTVGQGNVGGNGASAGSGFGTSGGGGGAGAVGGNASGTTPGAGGAGTSAYSSWGLATSTGHNVGGTVYYAGGGTGGGYVTSSAWATFAGSNGGGGSGSSYDRGVQLALSSGGNGMANTGGGGGGGGSSGGYSGNGGSGIVIVRYTIA